MTCMLVKLGDIPEPSIHEVDVESWMVEDSNSNQNSSQIDESEPAESDANQEAIEEDAQDGK
jgi:hypothetical protein